MFFVSLQTLLHLAGTENTVDITTSCKFWDSPTRRFPALLSTGAVISTAEGIADHLIHHHVSNRILTL